MTINTNSHSIHQFQIQALDSEEVIDFSDFAGKKILVVNVASKCGFTYQYESLEQLYQERMEQLVIIGFPSNQFMGQEPGTEANIASFCSLNYGVTFPLTTKIKVKGKDVHPIYDWLTSKEKNGIDDFKVGWNFNKFLLDEQGRLIAHFGSGVKPLDNEIVNRL